MIVLREYRGALRCRVHARTPAEAKVVVRVVFTALARHGRLPQG
jgi:hypothetical protein